MTEDRTHEGPELVIIAALAEANRVIGRGQELPWHLPEDLRRFKRLTSGYPLLMGRKTFEAIVHQFGGPLPNRQHVVLSRQGPLPGYPEVAVYASLDAALAALAHCERVFIGGGGEVYAQCLARAHRMELTLVAGAYTGDAFFPPFAHLIGPVFEMVAEEPREGFRFVRFQRKE